jgi:hypothetical protein
MEFYHPNLSLLEIVLLFNVTHDVERILNLLTSFLYHVVFNLIPRSLFQCVDTCLSSDYVKPGRCPNASSLSVFDSACIHACNTDTDCAGTDKCCSHSCGVTCQRAQGLYSVPGTSVLLYIVPGWNVNASVHICG